ncbi:sel1 repeat family protein [Pelomyxa schiedti]|nr:sel1 repeat family protein [Pelomyxa schiedti]
MAFVPGAINNTRNEMMMEALLQLQVGNIDSALALVANASSLFDSEMISANPPVTLFQRAADAGGADAMCNLGLCYYSGNGVEKDIHKALTLWQRASESGDADAMCNVGVCYENGDGVEKDINKAVTLYKRAADGGSPNALYNLARRHSEGVDGLAKDLHQAHRLWLRAADFGHANSLAQLRNFLLKI